MNICQHLAALTGNLPGTAQLASMIDELFDKRHFRNLRDLLDEISTFSTQYLLGRTHHYSVEDFKQLRFRPGGQDSERTSVPLFEGEYEPTLKFIREVLAVSDIGRQQKILAGLTRLKSYFIHNGVSRSDLIEIRSTISSPYDGSLTDGDMTTIANTVRYMLPKVDHDLWSRPVLPVHLIPESDKTSPFVTKSGVTPYIRKQLPPYNIGHIMRYDGMISLSSHPEFFRNIYGVSNGVYNYSKPLEPIDDGPIGLINIIHEPGFKNRVVASPSLVGYSLGTPLNESLKMILKGRNAQGVFSHENTCEQLFKKLKASAGTMIYHSIDSSNFTDRLPYQLQAKILDVLEDLGYITKFDKLVMDYFAKAKYILNDNLISYGVGQPQGFLPSFNLCSLTNEVILAYSYLKTRSAIPTLKGMNRLPGKVIGDDIVIWDDDTAALYRRTLTSLGVRVNPTKSLSSDRLIEFTSKLITSEGIFLKKKIKPEFPNWESKKEAVSYYGLDGIKEFIKFDESELLNIYLPQPFGLGLGESGPVPDQLIPYYEEAVKVSSQRNLISEMLSKMPDPPPSLDDLNRQARKYGLLPEISKISGIERMDIGKPKSMTADLGYQPAIGWILHDFIEDVRKVEDGTLQIDDSIINMVNRVLNPNDPLSELFEDFCQRMTSPLQQTLVNSYRAKTMRLIRLEELSGANQDKLRELDGPKL